MGNIRSNLQQIKCIVVATIALLLFQNCTPANVVIDEELKSKTLSSKNLLTGYTPSENGKVVNFTFVCPHSNESESSDVLRSGELKAVIEKFDFEKNRTTVVCEVQGIKKQILDSRSVDLSDCKEIPGPKNAHLDLYIVAEEIQSDFKQHKLNIDTTPLAFGGYSINYLAMAHDAKNSTCDDAGAPLVIQLSSTMTSLSLTAPTDGVEINLLGTKSYKSSHDKVFASWFTPNSAGDVFVLVKPNAENLILGVDEMFADTTRGPDMKYAKQGFAALGKFDDNKDLLISSEDVVFGELRLWKDSNHDGQTQEAELSTLAEQKIRAIDLRFVTQYSESDAYGNQSRNKSVVVMEDQSYGVVFDLWLRFIHKAPKFESKPAETVRATEPVEKSNNAADAVDSLASQLPDSSREIELPTEPNNSPLEETK